ncbi:MAG: hypothetical protein ABSF98_08945 [Bryobacteraceae bacterium]
MPGTIVVLSVLYGLWAINRLPQPIGGTGSIIAALWGLAFFLVSYALGSILSLRAAGRTDRLSASLVGKEAKPPLEAVKKRLLGFANGEAAWEWFSHGGTREPELSKGNGPIEQPESPEACGDLWAYDVFPYPCWSLVRLGVYCPREVFLFYWPYHKQILAQVGKSPHFFNYCKMAVYAGNGSISSPLSTEIQEAESNVRFLAGAFDALVISSAMLVAFVFYRGVLGRFPLVLLPIIAVGAVVLSPGRIEGKTIRKFSDGRGVRWAFRFVGILACSCLIVPFRVAAPGQLGRLLWPGEPESLGLIVLAIAEYLLAWGIVSQGRLRTRRHAEVAAVMDAFYLTCGLRQADSPPTDKVGEKPRS